MSRQPAIRKLVAEFSARRPIRSTSLIISLFGDVVTQHGGVIWLGSMVEALAQLGLDERLVRTSAFRLVQDGWLDTDKLGRRSFYRFSERGLREYQRVERRIYARELPPWDGRWTLLIPVSVPEESRDAFRRAMDWQGFGTLAPNLYAHPGAERAGVDAALRDLGLQDGVVEMEATTEALQSKRLINDVLWDNWDLASLEAHYQAFEQRFRPFERKGLTQSLDDRDCFVLRQLVVHDYRRVLLHDTDLPPELLPSRWPGTRARTLAADLYKGVSEGSERYIREQLIGHDAPMPAASAGFWQRFVECPDGAGSTSE